MTIDLTVPGEFRGLVRLGTSSWRYDSWKGLVYEPGKRYLSDDYLPDYARVLDSVEVDQWFYSLFPRGVRLPDPKAVRRYASSVPDDFVFTVKAPNALTLTHFRGKEGAGRGAPVGDPNPNFLSRDLLGRFLYAIAPLGAKLGPVMFQFEYLNRKKMASRELFLEKFGEFIAGAPGGVDYALEIRNPNYLVPGFFEFLQSRRLGFVYFEGAYMPPIGSVFDEFHPATAPFQVVRLHGGRNPGIGEKAGAAWDAIVDPKPRAIADAVRIVKANARKKVLTHVIFSNHLEGSAPLSARRFLDILEGGLP